MAFVENDPRPHATATSETLPLAIENRHPRDAAISFDPVRHIYSIQTVRGSQVAPQSASKMALGYFEGFDPIAVVERFYEQWKGNAESKYYDTIDQQLKDGGSDEDAKEAIRTQWREKGTAAAESGTLMHADAERLCNGISAIGPRSVEMEMLQAWLSEFEPHMQWKPYRTEQPLWYEWDDAETRVVVAGTPDLLMRSDIDPSAYALVDFKRTDPLTRGLLGEPSRKRHWRPRRAQPPLAEVEDSDYGKYAMQLNVLAKILRERYEIDVGANMILLQLHPGMPNRKAHWTRVPIYKNETDDLFKLEYRKLLEGVGGQPSAQSNF